MAIDGLKPLFGFDKLLLIVYMHIHFVHFYDISAGVGANSGQRILQTL